MSLSLHAEPAAAAAAASRHSSRQRQEPFRLQAEQEGEVLSRSEAADVEAALLLSLQDDDADGTEELR